ncbi:hypothetical protein NDU88_008127 [Pleurodeles waltl]|uniref:Uncharacterized protein n=1 Tax=Pleurodeles waltl TaxID=8319 RepID=A0AAV7N423_PLEWA|nr:hypothetical protein NDU88_008127 [Pleurodeles waltl]
MFHQTPRGRRTQSKEDINRRAPEGSPATSRSTPADSHPPPEHLKGSAAIIIRGSEPALHYALCADEDVWGGESADSLIFLG